MTPDVYWEGYFGTEYVSTLEGIVTVTLTVTVTIIAILYMFEVSFVLSSY